MGFLRLGGTAFFLTLLLSPAPAGAAGVVTRDPYGLARRLDPIKDDDLRPRVAGAYRSPFGAQVHETCFHYLAKSGVPRELAEKGIEAGIRKTIESILACRAKYSELDPYLKPAISQLRRTVFTCVNKSQSKLDIGAMNLPFGISVDWFHSPRETRGIEHAPLDPLARIHDPIVALPRDALIDAPSGTAPAALPNTLLHEALHSTPANNRTITHDRVERTPPDPLRMGETNVLDDRVRTIDNLCAELSGAAIRPLEGSIGIHKRIEHFGRGNPNGGLGRGCIRLFTDRVSFAPLRLYWPSRPLDNRAALSLCRKIADEGRCREARLPERRDRLAQDHPALAPFQAPLGARLDALSPPEAATLPAALLESFPAHRDGLRALGSTPCFREVLKFNPDGSLSALEPQPPRPAEPFIERLKSRGAKAYGFFRTFGQAPFYKPPGRCSFADYWRLSGVIEQLRTEVRQLIRLPAFQDVFLARAQGLPEKYAIVRVTEKNPHRQLRDLIGPALFDAHTAALRTAHPLSPDFDCEAAGLSPYESARKIGEALELLQRGPATESCGPGS